MRRAVLTLAGVSSFIAIVPSVAHAEASPESQFVASLNAERDERGLESLERHANLDAIAERHSNRMYDAGEIYHNDNLADEIPGSWISGGENVGVGYDLEGLSAAFMASPGHRHNILEASFDEIGLGVVTGNGEVYVTEVFVDRGVDPSSSISYRGARSGSQGQRMRLAAHLSGGGGSLGGRQVMFEGAGFAVRATTDPDGIAETWIMVDAAPGPSAIVTSFAGSARYAPARVTSTFTTSWPHTVSDRDAGAVIYLSPATQQFLILEQGRTSGIRHAPEMHTQLLPAGQAVTVISYRADDLAFSGAFDLDTGTFLAVISTDARSTILRST